MPDPGVNLFKSYPAGRFRLNGVPSCSGVGSSQVEVQQKKVLMKRYTKGAFSAQRVSG